MSPHHIPSCSLSTVYESQSQNADDCLAKVFHSKCNIGRDIDWCRKLHSLIIDASSAPIIKTPSLEQKKKVEELVKLEKARRRAEKDHHSEVKKGRRGDNNGDDCFDLCTKKSM